MIRCNQLADVVQMGQIFSESPALQGFQKIFSFTQVRSTILVILNTIVKSGQPWRPLQGGLDN